jgi:hypothetical protein
MLRQNPFIEKTELKPLDTLAARVHISLQLKQEISGTSPLRWNGGQHNRMELP